MNTGQILQEIREFNAQRDWARFHTPKNLSAALSVEAAELLELFQWLTPEESGRVMEDPVRGAAVRDEVADVLIYLLQLAGTLGIDLEEAVRLKMQKNALKHPIPPSEAGR